MVPWLPFERRWRDALVTAMIPRVSADGAPGLGEVDVTDFWQQVDGAAPPLLRLGLRAAVWGLTWSPVLLIGRPRTFSGLSEEERDAALVAAANHRLYPLRQLIEVIKLLACFAYERSRAQREAL